MQPVKKHKDSWDTQSIPAKEIKPMTSAAIVKDDALLPGHFAGPRSISESNQSFMLPHVQHRQT